MPNSKSDSRVHKGNKIRLQGTYSAMSLNVTWIPINVTQKFLNSHKITPGKLKCARYLHTDYARQQDIQYDHRRSGTIFNFFACTLMSKPRMDSPASCSYLFLSCHLVKNWWRTRKKYTVYWHKWPPNIFPLLVQLLWHDGWILLLLSFHLIPLHIIFSKIGGERGRENVEWPDRGGGQQPHRRIQPLPATTSRAWQKNVTVMTFAFRSHYGTKRDMT